MEGHENVNHWIQCSARFSGGSPISPRLRYCAHVTRQMLKRGLTCGQITSRKRDTTHSPSSVKGASASVPATPGEI
uniref:Uncharacterized protein n=1 Tax=Lutzomyia longipalpis TaxID=7200 RepID=A0A1B0GKD4_LUTLO